MANPELSRRVARVMSIITEKVGIEKKWKIADEVGSVDTFEELSKATQKIIIEAEKKLKK